MVKQRATYVRSSGIGRSCRSGWLSVWFGYSLECVIWHVRRVARWTLMWQ